MKAELIPGNGDPPIPITRDVTVIGRREFCDLVVPHPSLSKRHCVLVRTDGLLVVRDLVSTNGTKVNGQRVSWAALMPNDRLTIGRCKYRVYLGPDDAPSPSERARAGRAAGTAAAGGAAGGLIAGGDDAEFAAPSPLSLPAHSASAETPRGSTDSDGPPSDDLMSMAGLEILDDEDDEVIELG